jgi:DNA polymerase
METKPDVLSKMKGLREIPQSMRAMVEEYNNHDVDSTHTLYKKFWGLLPDRERKLIDLTLRMFVEAKLEVNLELAEIARVEAEQEMAAAIALAGMTEKQLGSNPIVATKLESYGVEVPTKISKKTGKRTFAFAKSDEDFQDLLTHEDERVRNLANARLQVKSTLIRTRASRLILAGSTGKLPVGYGLAAAHTMRFGGANRMNMQNFPRGSTLRRAIRAPEGYVLVVADSGQIEARKAAWFAGARQILDAFATGVDIYAREASSTFGFEVIKTEHPVERFCGKVLVLGLGFGMGPPKYQGTLASGQMGMKVNLPLETCKTAVYGWRTRNHQIPTSWKDFDAALGFMSLGAGVMEYRNNIRFDAANGMIWYPNGSFRMYPDMHIDDDGNYCYRRGKVYHRLWGGTLMEHFSQGSSRDLIVEKMLIIDARWPVVMMSHDEIIALVPEDEADEALEYMLDEMSTPAEWCQDLPLSAEGGFSREYSK